MALCWIGEECVFKVQKKTWGDLFFNFFCVFKVQKKTRGDLFFNFFFFLVRYSCAFVRCVAQEQTESHFRFVLFASEDVMEDHIAFEAGALQLQTNGWVECRISTVREEPFLSMLASPPVRGTERVQREDESVCLSGGYGALGEVFAMSSLAAKQSVLVLGRSGLKSTKLLLGDVPCGFFKLDASILESVQSSTSLFECSTGRLIKLVLHLSGVAKDALYFNQSDSALKESFRSKCSVLKRLWRALGNRPVLWVLFSSISSVLGNEGQSSYSASNAFLDCFAERSPSVVSVNWGPWGGEGMFAKVASM